MGGSVFLPYMDLSEGKSVRQTQREAGNVAKKKKMLKEGALQRVLEGELSGGSAADTSTHFKASENVSAGNSGNIS